MADKKPGPAEKGYVSVRIKDSVGRPTFAPGHSGNPGGMKPGTRKKATLLAEILMSNNVEKIVNVVIQAAEGGDMVACKLILERIYPIPRPGDNLDARLSRIERAIGVASEETGRAPQLIESDDGYNEQGSAGTH